MLVAAGPCHLNEEHHVEMGTVSLDRTPYNLKQMTRGFGGNNSIWVSARSHDAAADGCGGMQLETNFIS